MATKQIKRRAGRARPDKRSKKKTGYVSQSLRPTIEENRLIQKAADLEGLSINFWSVRTLVAAAKKQIAAAAKINP
jgi:uncharacterized protein (DUF1778 family)